MRKVITFTLLLALLLPLSATATPTNSTLAPIAYPDGYVPYVNPASAIALAKLLWGEARGVASDTEKAATCWVAINRVKAGYGSLIHVLEAPGQFVGYRESNPVDPLLYALAVDVLIRWDLEECGYAEVGRVIPGNYLWFTGDGVSNHFRNAYRGGERWKWTLPSPYREE